MDTGAANVRSPGSSSVAGRFWIPIGSGLFIIALTGSAIVVPQLRYLHLLQSLIYFAVAIFGRRQNSFALGAGVAISVAWNSLELFVTHNMQRGIALFWSFVHTGQVRQLDTMMVPLGGLGHFILLAACLYVFLQQEKTRRSWWKLVVGGIVVLGYMALIVAIALPHNKP